jgi:predicted nucleotidyltransferase
MDQLRIKKMVLPLFNKHPAIEAAYLFGSAASGKLRSTSDIDIAIRLEPGMSPESGFELRIQLMDELERLLDRHTDVILLNNASLKLIHQVLAYGELLFARDETAERHYAIQKRKEYFDFKYYIEKDRRELRSFFGVA